MRLLVLSKHSVIRSALRHLFTSTEEVDVVGEAEGATNAEEIITRAFPDVVLVETVETTSPAMLQLVDKLRSLGNIPIVILTNDSSPRAARAMLRAGVTGYVLKESADTDLVSALRSAARGLKFLDSSLIDAIATEGYGGEAGPGLRKLSKRELQVLRLLVQGQSNSEIARELHVSPKTVDTYRGRIYEKCELRSRSDLMRYAANIGLISFGDRMSNH